MNTPGRGALDNVLMRWVQRHRSMTTLFRAPGADRRKDVRPASAARVIQAQREDTHSPEQAPVEPYELPTTIPAPTVVASKVAAAFSPAVRPGPGTAKAAAPVAGRVPGHPGTDSDWQRLETIFRKHQEQNEGKGDSHSEPPAAAMEQEPFVPAQPNEQKGLVDTSRDAPVRRDEIARENVRAALSPAQSIQRQIERPQPSSPSAVTEGMRREQPLDVSSVPHEQPVTEMTFDRASDETQQEDDLMYAAPDKGASDESPRVQSVPLQYAWHVQRIAEPETVDDEADTSPASDTMIQRDITDTRKISEPGDSMPATQPNAFRENQTEIKAMQPSALINSPAPAGGQGPVETLAPSRPRPQSKVASSQTVIQRQPENRPSSDELAESAAKVVDTEIGPLPADLWKLLGQSPPAAAPPEGRVQRLTDIPPTHPSTPPGSALEEAANPPAAMPAVIQRQTLTNDDLMPPGMPSHDEAEKSIQAEPDLDDLALRVYAEIRRRLAAECERLR